MLRRIREMVSPNMQTSLPLPREAGYSPIGEDTESDPIHPDSPSALERSTTSLIGEVQGGKGVYWAFWVLGAGVLLSWNVLICTMPLLSSFFPEESNVRSSLASWLSSVYCFGNLFFLGLAQRDSGKLSPSTALHASLVLLLVLSLLLTFPLLPIILPALSSNTILFPFLILLTLLLSLSTAILQWAVFALAALWGSSSILGVMSGQGGIAVLVSGSQVFLAVFSSLGGRTGETAGQSRLAGVGLWALGAIGTAGCMFAHRFLVRHPDYTRVIAPVLERLEGRSLDAHSKRKGLERSRHVFKKNWALELAVAYVFVVTLSVFPPITSRILSVSPNPSTWTRPSVFIPLHFLLFNIGDYLGRTYLSTIPSLMPTAHSGVLTLSFARTIFIPLFLICNVTPRQPGRSPWINSDTVYFLILLAFGASNGWISSLSMILASSPALNPRITDEEKDVAGTLAAFCLVAGLAVGSICSFGVNKLVTGSLG